MHPSRWLSPLRCLLTALGLALALPASAELITFDFTATVLSVHNTGQTLNDSVQVGFPFTGSYTFDSRVAGVPFGDEMLYESVTPGCGIEAQLGHYTIRSFQEPPLRISLANDSVMNLRDSYSVTAWGGELNDPNLKVAIVTPVLLRDQTQTVFSSTELPLSPPDLDSFSIRLGHVAFERLEGGELASVWTSLDSLTLRGPTPVPDAGSLSLLAFTALPLSALWARKRLPFRP